MSRQGKEPGSADKVFLAVAGALILSGLGCLLVGLVMEQERVAGTGCWVEALGVSLMFLQRELGRWLG
jgi:hypothetical protein